MATEKWDPETARQLRATATRIFTEHGPHDDAIGRDNCAACAVATCTADTAPNYASWLRLWIQAGKPVPRQHYESELAEAEVENPAYYAAILRDIETFGITYA